MRARNAAVEDRRSISSTMNGLSANTIRVEFGFVTEEKRTTMDSFDAHITLRRLDEGRLKHVKCEQERHNEDKRNTIFMMSQKPRISASFLKRHLDIPFVSLIKILKKAPKVTFAIYSRIYSESKNNLFSSIVHNSKALVTACPPFWICLQIYFCSRRKRIFWDILCIHPEEGSKQWLRKRRVEAGKVTWREDTRRYC